jgi:Ca-activated chloride channel family protein
MKLAVCVAILPAFMAAASAQTQQVTGEAGDKTLSPYFLVQGGEGDVEGLPLKSTSARANIAGVIADVLVTQVYQNTGKTPIEAIYVFPASTRAAVNGMKMTIGERVIEAKIKKRDEARQDYERARNDGRNASLLEQQRPNVFQMNVANIMPGDEIKVELTYTELLVPTDKVYEFMYPTVVGPRYSNKKEGSAPESEKWVKNPYTRQGTAPAYAFDMKVNLAAGMPIGEISCATHKVDTAFSGPATASVTLDGSEKSGGNRDFILRYRLSGSAVQSGLLLYEGEKENFFLLMMQPPARVTSAQIPGREYIFIVDVSGSMHGFPLEISKELLRNLIGALRPTDVFNVLLFAGSSSLMSPESLPATPQNIANAIQTIDRQQGGGGTELLPAMQRALSLKKPEHFSRTVVIATDGYVSVEPEAFDLIGKNLGRANMFAFGIGTAVNRHLIEGMAHVGMGEPFVITRPDQARAKAEEFKKMIQSPVLTEVKVAFSGLDTYDVQPASIPDVLAERPVVVFGKYRGSPSGEIVLTGVTGDGRHHERIKVAGMSPSKENAALRYLWARHRIQVLSDYNNLAATDARVKEVTDLGLNYNLLTAYTSFVAVDSEIRNKGGQSATVKQPLPLPDGVSDYAVGGAAPAAAAGRSGGMGYMKMSRVAAEAAPVYTLSPAKKEQQVQKPAGDKQAENEDRSSKAVALKLVDVKVSGPMSREDAKKRVESKLKELSFCSGVAGKIEVEITVAADGSVKNTRIISGASNGGSATKWCFAGLIWKWRFASSPDGKESVITVTLEAAR